MMTIMDDFIYPVRLYARTYHDVNDYVIEGAANSKTPAAQSLENDDADADAGTVLIRAAFLHAEERDAALKRAQRLVLDREGLLWLLAPEERFFQLHRGMPEVYIPDAQGEGMRAEGEREIIVRVAPWSENI